MTTTFLGQFVNLASDREVDKWRWQPEPQDLHPLQMEGEHSLPTLGQRWGCKHKRVMKQLAVCSRLLYRGRCVWLSRDIGVLYFLLWATGDICSDLKWSW